MTSLEPNDFLPTASIKNLQARAKIIDQVHQFFHQRGFFHVETPLLSRDTVVDQHLHPMQVESGSVTKANAIGPDPFWLQTSPEFAMKRLVSAGANSIYQIGKAFRREERGSRHNPEFTMLEWYRVGDDMAAGMSFLAELVDTVLDRPPTTQMTYAGAFQEFVNLNPINASVETLRQACTDHHVDTTAFERDASRDDLLNVLLSLVVEPALARTPEPKIIFDWPASQAALAVVRPSEGVAERFEIYVDGIELANGYHELLDAEEMQSRNQTNNAAREKDGEDRLPEQSRLMSAMRHHFPPCAGVALGIDRLVMIAIGAESIDEVIAFPIERA